jgi:dipeptidyl aminopeptidase/acylaminoacyl peptidase
MLGNPPKEFAMLKLKSLSGYVAGAALALAFSGAAQGQARPMNLSDLGRIVRVSDAQIAPDGRSVLILVSRANYAEDRFVTDLVLVDVASGAQRALVHDRRGLSSPRWSPSGDRVAFLATEAPASGTATEPRAQIFTVTAARPGAVPVRVTSAPQGVQQFAWRPNGTYFAYVTADEPEPKVGDERFNDSFEVGNNDYLITTAPTPSHIWLVASSGGVPPRRLTSGAWSLPTFRPPGAPPSPLTWSPDGTSLTFTRVPTPRSGDFARSTVHVLDVNNGTSRALTNGTEYEGFGVFSPDGKQVAYSYPREGNPKFGNEIRVAAAYGSRGGMTVTPSIDRNIARAIWMPGGKALLIGANDERRVGLWIQPIGEPPTRIETGATSPSSSFWVDVSVGPNSEIAFAGSEPNRPTELYFMASPTSQPKRLTDFNHDVAALSLGRIETIDWQGPNGFHENGIVIYPPGFAPGHKYPLVLEVHGGPRAASLETFAARPQIMAAKGWIVFQPNYRGSDNLGNMYTAAINNDAGEGPGRDVMAGVAALVKRGFIDTTRIAVSGWSYGGYMSTWLAGRYPHVWRSAVIGAPVTNWLDQYNLGDANVRRATAFGGSPYTSPARMQAYVAQSPLSVAGAIRAPTLILHDLRDDRVPVTQGYELFHMLQDNSVTTRFVVYPIAGHNAADPVRQRDVTRRWIDWIEAWFMSVRASRE